MPEHGIFQGAWHDLMTHLFGEKATEPFPTDSLYPVDVYCGEYDPICDAPSNWWNLLASWNAMAALGTVHGGYADFTSADIDAAELMSSAGNVSFYMIPTEHLPMLQLFWNTPLEQLLDEWLRPIIDSAYDRAAQFGVDVPILDAVAFPDLPDLTDVVVVP